MFRKHYRWIRMLNGGKRPLAAIQFDSMNSLYITVVDWTLDAYSSGTSAHIHILSNHCEIFNQKRNALVSIGNKCVFIQ